MIGYIWYEKIKSNFTNKQMSYILDSYVEESERGKGYGRILINKLKEKMKEEGIDRIDLSVSKSNKARQLYEKEGFETTMMRMSINI